MILRKIWLGFTCKTLAMALKKAFMKNILIFSWIINISQKLFVLLQEDLLKAPLFTR